MIRQAHTYLVSAMSGATLIAVAIAAFVLLVSAQVFRDWPIAALGGNGNGAAVSDAQGDSGSASTASAAATANRTAAASVGAGRRGDGSGAAAADLISAKGAAGAQGAGGGSEPSAPATGANGSNPTGSSSSPASGGGGGGSGAGGGGSKSASTPAGKVTETVNGTVDSVDETALGGALNEAGVTEVTEGVVNGVVGPESAVGKVVNETVEVVNGLLHPKG